MINLTIFSCFILAAGQEWIRPLGVEERDLHFKGRKLYAKSKDLCVVELKSLLQEKPFLSRGRCLRIIDD